MNELERKMLESMKELTKKKKLFLCCIKSHCEAPDFEETVEAESMEEALEILETITHWDRRMLAEFTVEWI